MFEDAPIIHSYTRREALEDGFQVEIPQETSKEAGIVFPVFMNRSVWDTYVEIPKEAEGSGQDIDGRLWDILYMMAFAIRSGKIQGDRGNFKLYVNNSGKKAKEVELKCQVGPLDFDNPKPAITIMLPNED